MLFLLFFACHELKDTNVITNTNDTSDVIDSGRDYHDFDLDGYSDEIDCDDTNPKINPGANEICDGLDNNCDGVIDEDATDRSLWFVDGDADGYGSVLSHYYVCFQPTGYVLDSNDCDDYNPEINPGANESCDGIDNNCDLDIDEVEGGIWYLDSDEDGYGNIYHFFHFMHQLHSCFKCRDRL